MATETDPVAGSRKPGLWVTGATGFIGSHLLNDKTRDRYRVIAHARSTERIERLRNLPPADAWSFGDLQAGIIDWPDDETIETTLHLASPSSWSLLNDPKVYDWVIDSVKLAWRQTVENGGKHFVFVSSASALGGYDSRSDWKVKRNHQLPRRSRFPYAAAKFEAEQWLMKSSRDSGIKLSVVYPGEVYGAGDFQMITAGTIQSMTDARVCLVSSGGTHVADLEEVTQALWAGVEGEAATRALIAGEFLEFREIAKIARNYSGKRGPIITLPNWIVNAAIQLREKLGIDLVGHPDAAARYGQVYWQNGERGLFSHEKISMQSGRQGIEKVAEWLMRNTFH